MMWALRLGWVILSKSTCTGVLFFFFQAEDGIRDLVRSRGLGDVYKRQGHGHHRLPTLLRQLARPRPGEQFPRGAPARSPRPCLLYTSDAADDLPCVDLGGRRIIKKQKPPFALLPTPTHASHFPPLVSNRAALSSPS